MTTQSAHKPVVLAVLLSNTLLNMPALNNNDVVGNITVISFPPSSVPSTPVTLGGIDAALFAITNNGNIPCQLVVGNNAINAGSYSISLTAN